MKTSEVIKELQKLLEENGDCEFSIYKSFSKETSKTIDVFYDDELKDICIGVYA